MVTASVGKKQIGKTMLAILIIAVVVVIAIVVIGKIKDKGEENGMIPGETVEQREEYLRSVGIQVDPTSAVAEVKVPEEFDERFTQYNEMLKTTGFDLSGLKGQTVKKCTYTITNRPELGSGATAILLVYEGKIVGGHLLVGDDGTLQPLYQTGTAGETGEEGAAEETILPSAEVPQEGTGEVQETAALEGAYPTE